MTSSARRQHQAGIALIAVLLLLVFILTIVGGLFYRHQIHIQKVTRSLVGEQAQMFLLSAESWAKSVLEEDARRSGTDHLEEIWARELPVLPIEGGLISGCLVDLQGLFNINRLGGYTNRSWEDELNAEQFADTVTTERRALKRLLRMLDLDDSDSRVAALVDWLDPDAWLVSPDSAEDNEYLLLDPPYRAANHSLTEFSELSLVQGFGGADVAALQPWVNIVADEVGVNVNTAPPLVLMALSPSITADNVASLQAARPFETVEEFYSRLAGAVGQSRDTLMAEIPDIMLAVASRYFELRARVELAGLTLEYRSTIQRQSANRTVVLSRTLRHVPPLVKAEGVAAEAGNGQYCQPPQQIPDSVSGRAMN